MQLAVDHIYNINGLLRFINRHSMYLMFMEYDVTCMLYSGSETTCKTYIEIHVLRYQQHHQVFHAMIVMDNKYLLLSH